MIDIIYFESPYGTLGRIINKIYLKKYLETGLLKRYKVIKEYAETEKCKVILNFKK